MSDEEAYPYFAHELAVWDVGEEEIPMDSRYATSGQSMFYGVDDPENADREALVAAVSSLLVSMQQLAARNDDEDTPKAFITDVINDYNERRKASTSHRAPEEWEE